MPVILGALVLAASAATTPDAAAVAAGVVWRLDNLTSIGGHPVQVVGAPVVVDDAGGRAIEFDGVDDGLFLDVNPLERLERFTIEAVVAPSTVGPEEQRFLHVAEAGSESRAMMETRVLPGGTWTLDTFLRSGTVSLALLDRANTHPGDRWHVAALTFDGTTMAHYVNGVRELSGPVAFKPLGPGRTSIGVRQNLVSWFKGRIRAIRFTPEVLPAARMLTR
jgi:hypothetical protein